MANKRKSFDLPQRTKSFIGEPTQSTSSERQEYELMIKIDEIAPSPHQTREDLDIDSPSISELASNIEANGLINPITVRPYHGQENGYRWLLVAGEGRLLAHKKLGRKLIRATVKNNIKEESQAWAITVSENVVRKQLKPTEAGRAIDEGRSKFKYTHEEIAKKMGLSKDRVVQLHGANKLPADLLNILDKNDKLTNRHINAFKSLLRNNKLDTIEHQENDNEDTRTVKDQIHTLLNRVIDEDLTGEETVLYAKEMIKPRKEKSFLTTMNKKLPYLIKNRPQKMSEQKRKLVITQAENMIWNLQKLIKEEKEKLLQKPQG